MEQLQHHSADTAAYPGQRWAGGGAGAGQCNVIMVTQGQWSPVVGGGWWAH